ncbi:unnamed protein product [Paramecium sonneborni]|uniref:Uncharacterized protein n=1 Tax=Paramecium sonneborni TaxID=65129 RepID=A0A8S1RF80_9CILI|nr:unnamed protein product [Paramecium sonneborni]
MSAHILLQQKMDHDKYFFATLLHSSIIKTQFGYLGFMITEGLWIKLSVYYCFEIPKKITITEAETFYFLDLEKCQAKKEEIIESVYQSLVYFRVCAVFLKSSLILLFY